MSGWLRILVELVEEKIGINVLPHTPVERRLSAYARRRARELGHASPTGWLLRMEREAARSLEWQGLITRLANGQTCFFRDPEQFRSIGALLAEGSREGGGRPLRIWSSACATGEEAYSLAMLCRELGIQATIHGTDINSDFLRRALYARYEPWLLRHVEAGVRRRWFRPEGDLLVVSEKIREMVCFQQHNLAVEGPLQSDEPRGRWDLIVCRNVLLYFRRPRVGEICGRLSRALAEKGGFVLSASESLHGLSVPLEPVLVSGRVVYRRGERRNVPTAAAPAEKSPRPRSDASRLTKAQGAGGLAAVLSLARGESTVAAREALLAGGSERPGLLQLLTLGHLHMREHAFAEALAAYEAAEEIDSLLFEVHLFKGIAHRKQKRWAEAAEAFRRALFLSPALWQASYMLGGVHERMGRWRQALREKRGALCVLEQKPSVTFLSDPLFVDWFCPSAAEVRRVLSGTQGERRP